MDQSDNELWPNQPLQAAAGVQPVASDIPVSAVGRGASAFTGVMDNTDDFFKGMRLWSAEFARAWWMTIRQKLGSQPPLPNGRPEWPPVKAGGRRRVCGPR